MSIPTHNLYDFIYQVTKKQFNLLYFFPFGYKDVSNLIMYDEHQPECAKLAKQDLRGSEIFKENSKFFTRTRLRNAYQPVLLCHDQEPLCFDLYQGADQYRSLYSDSEIDKLYHSKDFNIRWKLPENYQQSWIILHSELNSGALAKYESTGMFVGAYYWSHAFLSLDWYRFAKYDKSLVPNSDNEKHFLIYCRATSGSRNYRKLFLEKLQTEGMYTKCQVGSFNYRDAHSDLSATYDAYDIRNTDFHLILETVFDERIHLTEKTCRALATGHPFFLAAGTNSLELLRYYGFKTFSPWIDESYDKETDSCARIEKIIYSMKKYSNQPDSDRKAILKSCQKIAQYNKKHFFSDAFYKNNLDELTTNIEKAFRKINNQFDFDRYFKNHDKQSKNLNPDLQNRTKSSQCLIEHDFFSHLKKGGTVEDYVPPDLN